MELWENPRINNSSMFPLRALHTVGPVSSALSRSELRPLLLTGAERHRVRREARVTACFGAIFQRFVVGRDDKYVNKAGCLCRPGLFILTDT